MTAPAQVAFPDRILKDRIEGFVGRAWAIDEVAKWIDTETGDRFMLIMGEPGCGKTALAAWMAGFGEQQAESMPKQFATVRECWTAKHFCFAEERRGSVHPARFAQALASQISQRFPYFGQCILESETSTVIGHAEAKVNWGTVIGAYIENLI